MTVGSIPRSPIRPTIAGHDNPTIADILPPDKGAAEFLFPPTAILCHTLRECDRLYMLTIDGVIEDLLRDASRGKATAASDVIRQNAQRHIDERLLYGRFFADTSRYRFDPNGAFYQTTRGKQLFRELQGQALRIPEELWGRWVEEQLAARSTESARVDWETKRASQVAETAIRKLRATRPAHADLAEDAWNCALPALRDGAHISAVYHTPTVLDLAVEVGLAEEFDDIFLAQLIVAAICHDTGNALEPKAEKKIRKRDIEANPNLRELAIEQRRRHMKASACLVDVYLAARRDLFVG